MNGLTKAASDVLAERARQIEAEGYTPEHDDQHTTDELALAAASYAFSNKLQPAFWPWDESAWKPKDERANLVRAAALLMAAIERHDRMSERGPVETPAEDQTRPLDGHGPEPSVRKRLELPPLNTAETAASVRSSKSNRDRRGAELNEHDPEPKPSGLVPLSDSCQMHGHGRITPPAMVTPGAPGCTCGMADTQAPSMSAEHGALFDAFGRERVRYVRVTLDGSHLILHPSELEAWKAGEENHGQFTYTDVYLSEEEADALPEFDGF